jgi:hypothetical protein
MIKSDIKVRELKGILSGDNAPLISEAIGLLRDSEPFEGAVGLLALCYDTNENPSVKKAIEQFMNDLKDQSVCGEVIDEIKKPLNQNTLSMLVSSCWQSGLDYSEYSAELAEVFMKGDYFTALECLTVIEESSNDLSKSKKEEIIKMIISYPPDPDKEKSVLTNELLSILRNE